MLGRLPENGIDDDGMEHVAANAGKVIINADAVDTNDSLPDQLHLDLQAIPWSSVLVRGLVIPIRLRQ